MKELGKFDEAQKDIKAVCPPPPSTPAPSELMCAGAESERQESRSDKVAEGADESRSHPWMMVLKECVRARKEHPPSSSEETMSRAFEGMFSKQSLIKSEVLSAL